MARALSDSADATVQPSLYPIAFFWHPARPTYALRLIGRADIIQLPAFCITTYRTTSSLNAVPLDQLFIAYLLHSIASPDDELHRFTHVHTMLYLPAASLVGSQWRVRRAFGHQSPAI
jgi:hypothetical protein